METLISDGGALFSSSAGIELRGVLAFTLKSRDGAKYHIAGGSGVTVSERVFTHSTEFLFFSGSIIYVSLQLGPSSGPGQEAAGGQRL